MKKIISVLIVVSFMVLLAAPTLAASKSKVDLSANLTLTFAVEKVAVAPALPDVNTVIEKAVAGVDFSAVQEKEAVTTEDPNEALAVGLILSALVAIVFVGYSGNF